MDAGICPTRSVCKSVHTARFPDRLHFSPNCYLCTCIYHKCFCQSIVGQGQLSRGKHSPTIAKILHLIPGLRILTISTNGFDISPLHGIDSRLISNFMAVDIKLLPPPNSYISSLLCLCNNTCWLVI